MTRDLDPTRDRQRSSVVFLDAIEPLLLLDPSAAAHLLGIKRHTLACYRSLGDGPPYYKFGRWVRYTASDLRVWASRGDAALPHSALTSADFVRRHAAHLVDTRTAARFLTVSRFCLCNYRADSSGPPFSQFGRRIYYSVEDLWRWAKRQRQAGANTINRQSSQETVSGSPWEGCNLSNACCETRNPRLGA